jgi:hypothetical protein
VRRWILVFGHGVDEQREQVLLYDDDPYSASLNLVVMLSRVFVHIAFLVAQELLERGRRLVGGGLDSDPVGVGGCYFCMRRLAGRKVSVPPGVGVELRDDLVDEGALDASDQD